VRGDCRFFLRKSTQFLFLLAAKGVLAVPGFGFCSGFLLASWAELGTLPGLDWRKNCCLGGFWWLVQQLAGGSELGRALEEKLSRGLLFGLKEAEEVAANGAAEWVQALPLELPQVPAVLLRPPHPGLHQRCFAVPFGMSDYGNWPICIDSRFMAYAFDLDVLLHYQN